MYAPLFMNSHSTKSCVLKTIAVHILLLRQNCIHYFCCVITVILLHIKIFYQWRSTKKIWEWQFQTVLGPRRFKTYTSDKWWLKFHFQLGNRFGEKVLQFKGCVFYSSFLPSHDNEPLGKAYWSVYQGMSVYMLTSMAHSPRMWL